MDEIPQNSEQPDPTGKPGQLETAGGGPPIVPKSNQSRYDIDTIVVATALQMLYETQSSDELICEFSEVLGGGSSIQLNLLPGWVIQDAVGNLTWTQSGDRWSTTITEQMLDNVVVQSKEYQSTFSFVDSKSGTVVDPRVRVRRVNS